METIKVTDLRIGNIVKWGIHECVIKGIHTDTVTGKDPYVYGSVMIGAMPIHTIEGIDLTPEWLIKLGFKKVNDGVHHTYYVRYDFWIYILGDGRFEIELITGPERHNLWRSWRYVHELQNIHFAILGEELTQI